MLEISDDAWMNNGKINTMHGWNKIKLMHDIIEWSKHEI